MITPTPSFPPLLCPNPGMGQRGHAPPAQRSALQACTPSVVNITNVRLVQTGLSMDVERIPAGGFCSKQIVLARLKVQSSSCGTCVPSTWVLQTR
jgi:hypothetical protein